MPPQRRALLVSKGWVQAVVLVVLTGFFILGLLAYRTYQAQPPVPRTVVDPQGRVVYTGEDISKGQQVFLHNGLMEYGSAFGHGAYLGPDYTADYLRRSANLVRRSYGGAALRHRRRKTIEDLRTNRYDKGTGTLALTRGAGRRLPRGSCRTTAVLLRPDDRHGLRAKAITDPDELRGSPPSSPGRRGRPPPSGRATTTPTRTTGRRSRAWTTSRPRT